MVGIDVRRLSPLVEFHDLPYIYPIILIRDFKKFDQMQFMEGYAAVLIIVGQVLAVVGVLLVLYMAVRQRLKERVETVAKPERTGLPYPDLYYWHVLRQRSSIMSRIRRAFRRGKSEGI